MSIKLEFKVIFSFFHDCGKYDIMFIKIFRIEEQSVMKCKITLQERLKNLRVMHNLNLEELAKLTGISKSALGNY